MICPVETFDRRLMLWDKENTRGKPWNLQEWLFGIELGKLTGPDDVEPMIIAPLLAMIGGKPDPHGALAKAGAITWPALAP